MYFLEWGHFCSFLWKALIFRFGSTGECFGSFSVCSANQFLPGRGALGAWRTAAELVRKDLIKHFCAEKHQLVKIPTICRKELRSLKLLSGKFLWHVCTCTGVGVCMIPY